VITADGIFNMGETADVKRFVPKSFVESWGRRNLSNCPKICNSLILVYPVSGIS
jgi:hypothetical protein